MLNPLYGNDFHNNRRRFGVSSTGESPGNLGIRVSSGCVPYCRLEGGSPPLHRVGPVTGAKPKDDWAAPGAFKVTDRIFRIPLPLPTDGPRAVNVYVLLQPDGIVMVDAGWAVVESREACERALSSLGVGLGDIERFLVTHAHRDHYTQAVAVRREFATPIALGVGERPSLRAANAPNRRPNQAQLDQLASFGAPELLRELTALRRHVPIDPGMWEAPDQWLSPGDLSSATARGWRSSRRPATLVGTWYFSTTPTDSCSPGTMCCRTLPRRSVSNPC